MHHLQRKVSSTVIRALPATRSETTRRSVGTSKESSGLMTRSQPCSTKASATEISAARCEISPNRVRAKEANDPPGSHESDQNETFCPFPTWTSIAASHKSKAWARIYKRNSAQGRDGSVRPSHSHLARKVTFRSLRLGRPKPPNSQGK